MFRTVALAGGRKRLFQLEWNRRVAQRSCNHG